MLLLRFGRLETKSDFTVDRVTVGVDWDSPTTLTLSLSLAFSLLT